MTALHPDRPLLSLVMIVKDEARSIRETIASVKPYVDRYTILDTHSKDGTPALITEAFGDTPGEVIQEPFVNYATTRNRALDLEEGKSIFQLMLSGDETLRGGEALRAFCQEHRDTPGPEHGAYLVQVQTGANKFYTGRLTRSGGGYRYAGVVHEVLVNEEEVPATIRVPGSLVYHDMDNADPERKRSSWFRWLEMLAEEARAKPEDARTSFYLAQTLEDLGFYEEAFREYKRRIGLGGWDEEVYESMYRLGRTARAAGKEWPMVQQLYLDAYAYRPSRAEPLFEIGWHWWEERKYPLAYLFAIQAYKIPYPKDDLLFVADEVYNYRIPDLLGIVAYWVGEHEIGEEAVRKALLVRPDEPHLLGNLKAYAAAREEKPGGERTGETSD